VSRLLEQPVNGTTYASSGVSIEAGDAAVERIKDIVASTKRPEVMGGIGGFGGLFALDTSKYTSPVLVASADGVGTKLDIARQVGRYDTVGIDLVAMLVDDSRLRRRRSPSFFWTTSRSANSNRPRTRRVGDRHRRRVSNGEHLTPRRRDRRTRGGDGAR